VPVELHIQQLRTPVSVPGLGKEFFSFTFFTPFHNQ